MSKSKTDERTAWQVLGDVAKASGPVFGESDRWRRVPSWPMLLAIDAVIVRTLYRRPS